MLEKLVGRRYVTLEDLKKDIEDLTQREVVSIIESESEKVFDTNGLETDDMIDYEFSDSGNVHTLFYIRDCANRYYITEV